MQLGIDSQIPNGLLAANALLAENSRQGGPTSTHTPHRGFEFAISSTYKGFQFRCPESASDPVVAPSNYPVISNPCPFIGRNVLLPSSMKALGAADRNNLDNYAADTYKGFPAGHFLDAQALASGTVGENRALGNYYYGAFMFGAGRSLGTALRDANVFAFFKSSYPDLPQMDSHYSFLPAANAQNIAIGYNAAKNGTLCK